MRISGRPAGPIRLPQTDETARSRAEYRKPAVPIRRVPSPPGRATVTIDGLPRRAQERRTSQPRRPYRREELAGHIRAALGESLSSTSKQPSFEKRLALASGPRL